MNTCAFLAKAAKYHGDEPAIRWGDELHCYRDFYDRALAIGGNLLARGLKPGDRVAFALANSPRILEVIFGCFAAGLVVVPINAMRERRAAGEDEDVEPTTEEKIVTLLEQIASK